MSFSKLTLILSHDDAKAIESLGGAEWAKSIVLAAARVPWRTKEMPCEVCGVATQQPKKGPAKRCCSDACRQVKSRRARAAGTKKQDVAGSIPAEQAAVAKFNSSRVR